MMTLGLHMHNIRKDIDIVLYKDGLIEEEII